MEIADAVRKIFQDMIVPELGKIREENQKIVAILEITNKRLDDVNTHLADQSRRIDDVRSELTSEISSVRSELTLQISGTRSELISRMEDIHSDLVNRLDANNKRIDRFFLTAATKEEQARNDA
jgi:hypothetical protein